MPVLDPPPSAAALERLSGIVKRITFHSVETGYSVLKVNSFQKPQEEITVLYQAALKLGLAPKG
jgi:exodeoxyribonuclease V alpha subunit